MYFWFPDNWTPWMTRSLSWPKRLMITSFLELGSPMTKIFCPDTSTSSATSISTRWGQSMLGSFQRRLILLLFEIVFVPMDTDKRSQFWFYCPATLHVTSQVLQPESVNKWYRGRHTFISHYTWKRWVLVYANVNANIISYLLSHSRRWKLLEKVFLF